MPTLEELFKNKQLPSQNGKTAEEAYAVRDSKNIRISAADPFVNTVGMSLSRLARKNLGVRESETFLEEEVTGARLIRTASMPFIYGSELPRLTLRTTSLLDTMKQGTNNTIDSIRSGENPASDLGSIGNFIANARDSISSKLGIPSTVIPSKIVVQDVIYNKGETQNRITDLENILDANKGTERGKILKDSVGSGNLKTIGKRAIGAALGSLKDRIRGKFFAERSTTGFNQATPNQDGRNTTINYGSITAGDFTNVGLPNKETGIRDANGLIYEKTLNLTYEDNDSSKINFIDGTEENGLASKTPSVVLRNFQLPSTKDLKAEDERPLYSTLFNNLKINRIQDSIDTNGNVIRPEKLVFPTIGESISEGETDSTIFGESGLEKHPLIETNKEQQSKKFGNLEVNRIEDSIDSDGNIIKPEKITFKTVDESLSEGEESSTILGKDGIQKHPQIETNKEERSKSFNNLEPNTTFEFDDANKKFVTPPATFPTIKEASDEGESNSPIIKGLVDGTFPERKPFKGIQRDMTKRSIESKDSAINNQRVYKASSSPQFEGTPIDDVDLVTLKFTSVFGNNSESVNFLSTISGLSETLSPSWDSHKFVGSAFNNYTYSGIERSVGFNFKVFSLNPQEHIIAWDKLNFLTSLVFPLGYYTSSAVVPPFIKLTLGDLYQNKLGFIESLTHTWDDNTPWETGEYTPNYILPKITDVAITIKFLEAKSTAGPKLYSFNPITSL